MGVESFPYYPHYETKEGDFGGYARDILDAFAKAQGHTLEYKPMPYLRVVKNLLNGDLDLQYPDNNYWLSNLKSNQKIIYSEPAVQYTDGLHIHPSNKGLPLDQIKTIGTLIGFSPIQYLPMEQDGKLKIHYSPTVKGLIAQVRNKLIDAVYLNTDVILYHEQGKPNGLIYAPEYPSITSGFSLSTINHPEIVQDFNHFLKAHAQDIQRIKDKYGLK